METNSVAFDANAHVKLLEIISIGYYKHIFCMQVDLYFKMYSILTSWSMLKWSN